MEGVIAIIMVFSIPIIAILTSYSYKMKKLQLKNDDKNDSDLRKQVGYLLAQQEETNEKIKQLQYLLSQNNIEIEDEDKRKIISPIELPDRLKNPKDFDNND